MTTQPFYNTGTAVLTNGSTAMVGTDTHWMGNIRQYDRVVGLDGKEAIVNAVVDDTHITLLRPWAGITQASAAYEIWMSPDEIFLQTLARQIFETLNSSALEGLAGLTPANRTMPYFDATATAQLTSLSDFARTLLDDVNAAAALITLGAIGGNLGTTDNVLLRSDGTGGSTAQGSKITVADNGSTVINKNAAAPIAQSANSALQLVGADGDFTNITIDAFAATATTLYRRANGTGAAPTAVQNGNAIGTFAWQGYGASAFATSASIYASATENFSNTARGTRLNFQTTLNGTATPRVAAYLDQDGSFVVNKNAAAPQAFSGNFTMSLTGADGVGARLLIDSYGDRANFSGRRANGTAAAPSALLATNHMFSIDAYGYGATGYAGPRGNFIIRASENWSDTAQGTEFIFNTTPNGSTVQRQVASLGNDGTLNILGNFIANGLSSSFITSQSFGPQVVFRNSAPDSSAGYVIFRKDRGTGVPTQAGDSLGTFIGQGLAGDGVTNTNSAYMAFTATAVGTGYVDGRIAYVTSQNGGSSLERMSVYSGVSIGSAADKGQGNLHAQYGLWINNSYVSTSPVITMTANYTVAGTEKHLLNNKSGSSNTLTLPAASSYPGREIVVTNLQAQTVVSATSNVLPKNGGAAGTAILAATVGVWALLASDGTNWKIMMSGT